MKAFLQSLATDAVVPVLAAYLGLVWKRLSKDVTEWTSEDRLLISDFLVAALFMQATFLAPAFWASLTGRGLSPLASEVLSWRLAMLGLTAVLVLPSSAAVLRVYTGARSLTGGMADVFSAVGATYLFLLFAFNGYIELAAAAA